ncbi:response regulator transcription factor [Muricauda sp. CAU 1633]|uniref:LytR/AlgR family response regulator transcription factor n=1 Tax=Allomuricauda sp. CAU 1633 TaxID=2816036 RepID=UPI001A8D629B|nr:LytTR family DNA-binding domain-containing protein [Muricauda sp. CAU 1633]MBO0321535.1 response regulator transcription factor [Muricauda sp. CAU 1633]
MGYSALIVDDEALARKRISSLLESWNQIEVLDHANNAGDAIQKIVHFQPDILFLDIQLKDLTGFDVLNGLKQMKNFPLIVFITAFDEYAIKSYEVQAVDFLLKPFLKERLDRSIQRCITILEKKELILSREQLKDLINNLSNSGSEYPTIHKSLKKVPIKIGTKTMLLKGNNIKYILASGSYAELHMEDRMLALRDSLSSLLKKFDKTKFIRIHRSTIINSDHIQEVITSSYYEIDVKMNDGELFRVSKSYRKKFLGNLGM